MNEKIKQCKACESEISKRAKKCPNCGEDQRGFFVRHKFLTAFLVIGFIVGLSSLLETKEEIDYVDYNYGDIIGKNNVVEGERYELPEGIEISFDKQDILTIEDLKDTNPFNSPNNDLAILTVSMENKSDKKISYNSLGFTYVTKNDVQLDDSWGLTLNVLPQQYASMESFSAGDLMPGSKFTRIISVEIPKDDPVKKIIWKYSDIKFTIELPV